GDPLRVLYYAIRGSPNGGSLGGRDVDAGMERAFAGKRILPVAEMAQQPAVHRPDRRHGVLLPGSRIGPTEAGKTRGLQEIIFVDGLAECGNQEAVIHNLVGAIHGSLEPKSQSHFASQ